MALAAFKRTSKNGHSPMVDDHKFEFEYFARITRSGLGSFRGLFLWPPMPRRLGAQNTINELSVSCSVRGSIFNFRFLLLAPGSLQTW
jgi:hypothetical protein